MKAIQNDIFKEILRKPVTAKIIAAGEGILSGTNEALKDAAKLGLHIQQSFNDATFVKKGDMIVRFSGVPKLIAMAEQRVMGHMAKFSGIATAAKKFAEECGSRPRVISMSWKKMPVDIRDSIRKALSVGGVAIRICDEPHIFMNKNLIKILGGIAASLSFTETIKNRKRVVQIHGRYNSIAAEACEAVEHGADIIIIDTGRINDVRSALTALTEKRLRHRVEIAFAGNIQFKHLEPLKTIDIDILEVGRAIVDAPLLDMRMEVE